MRLTDDLKRATRRLRARPGVTLFAMAMLGIAIGLTTSMATVIDALFVRRAPFAHAEQLERMESRRGNRGGFVAFRPSVIHAWSANPGFVGVEAASSARVLVTSAHASTTQNVGLVSPGLFAMLGVKPTKGRAFEKAEGRESTHDRVVMTESAWRMFSGDLEFVTGAPIVIGGQTAHVVGLMPSTLRFPAWDIQIWRAVDMAQPPPELARTRFYAYVRFANEESRPGTLASATEQAHAADSLAGHTVMAEAVWPSLKRGCREVNGRRTCTDRDPFFTSSVPVLGGATILVFLVLCANVASLLLTQQAARRREYGVCAALGAPRSRLLREVVAEGALLSVGGLAAGVAIAWVATGLVAAFLPDTLVQTTLNTIEIDGRALLVATAGGVAATALAGVLPAWIGTRVDPAAAMRGAARGTTASRAARMTMHGILVAEIALVCVLLGGATMLVRSFVVVATADRGLDVRGVRKAWVVLDEKTYDDTIAVRGVASRIERASRAIPGVSRAALSLGVPPDAWRITWNEWKSDVPGVAPKDVIDSYDVRSDFFDLFRISLRRGRLFQPGDAPRDVVVGERMAKIFWPGLDPIGRSFGSDSIWYRVIGVVAELELPTLKAAEDRPEFYRQFALDEAQFTVAFKCSSACPSEATIRHHLAAVAPGIRIAKVTAPEEEYAEHFARPRGLAQLAGIFGFTAVLAAALGLFGVVSFGVAQRTRELTIRAALGATAARIRGLVLRDGAKIAAAGVVLGSAGAWYLSRALSGLLYRVTRNDPETWLAVVAVIGFTTLAACWMPARRASRVDVAALARDG